MSSVDTNTTTTNVTNSEDTLLTFTYRGITFVTDPDEYEHIKSVIDANLEETDDNHEQHHNTTELRNIDNTRISIQAVKTDEVTLMATKNKSEASTRSNTTNLDDAFDFMSNSTLENNYDELFHISIENDQTVVDISNDTLKQRKINTTSADRVAKNIQNVYGTKLKIVDAKVTITFVNTLANESIPTGNVSHNRLSPVDNNDTNNKNNTDSNTISSSIASSNKNSTNDTITNIIRANTTAVINFGKTTPNITKMSPVDTNTTTTNVTNSEDTLLTFTYRGITFVTDPDEYEHIKSVIDANLEETDVNNTQHQNTTELRNKNNTGISIQTVKAEKVTLMVTENKSGESTNSNTTNLDDAFDFSSNSTLENNYDELFHISMENDHTFADISNDTLKQSDNIFGNSSITTFRLNSTDKSNDSFDDHYVSNDRIKTNVTKNNISYIIQTSPAIITDIGTTDSNKSTEVNTSVDDVAMDIKNVYGTKLKIVNARVTITVVDTTANESKPAGVVSNDGPVEYEDTQNDTKNTNDTDTHMISSDFTSSNVTNTNDTITDTFSANTTAVRTHSKTTSNTTNTSSVNTDTTTANLTTSEDNRFENISADLFHISMDNSRIVADISNVTVKQNDDILVNESTISLKINLTDRSKDSFDESSVSNDIMKTNITYDNMYNTNQTSPPVIEGYQSKVNERLFKLNDVNITTKINEKFISTTSSNMTLDTEINREIEEEDTITNASTYINEITFVANPKAYEHIKGVIDSNHIETDETTGSNGTHVTHTNNETNSNTDSVPNFTLDVANFVVETNVTATLLISPGISMTNVTEHEALPTNVSAESDTKSNSSLSDSLLPSLRTTMNSLNHTISTLIKFENKTDSLINRTILSYIEKQELDKQNKIDISVNISFPEFSNQTLPPDSQIMDKMFNNMSEFIDQDSYNDAQAKIAHNLNNKTDNLTERSDHDATNNFKNVYGTKLKVLSAETIISVVDASANESIPTDVLANDVLSPIEYEDENTKVINNTTTGVSIPIEISTENTTLGNVTIGILRNFEGENITLLRNVSKPDVQIQTGILNDKAEEIANNNLVNNTTVENRNYIKRNATAVQYEAANNSLLESLTLESMPSADNNTIHVEKEYSTEINNTIDVKVSTEQTVKTSASSLDPNATNVNTLSLTGNVTDYIEESTNASEIKDREQITVSNINVHDDTKSMVSVLTSNKTKNMIKSESAEGTIANSTVHEIKLLRDTVTINETIIFTALASNITKENNSAANNDIFHRSVLTDNNTDITESTAVNVTITLQHSKIKINASQLNLTIPRNDSVEFEMKLINNSSFILMSAVNQTVPNNGRIVNIDKTVNFSRDNINGLTNVSLLVNNTVVNLTSDIMVPEMSTSFAPTKVDATELTNETKTSETEILYFNILNITEQNTTHTYAGATKVEQVIDNGTTTTTNTTTTYATVPTFNTEPIISGKNNTTVLHEVNKKSLNNTATSTIQKIKLSKVNQVRISTASPLITDTQPSTVYTSAPTTLLPSSTKSDVSAKPTQTSTSFNFPAMSTSRFTVKRSIISVTKKPMIQNSRLSSKANVIKREDTTVSKIDTTTKTTKLQTGGFKSGSSSFFLFDVNLLGQNAFPFSNFGGK
ncbi:unnamed protein product [Mytilus coruscus]|uniref:Uncharacterized protein n=1 Tax=Mytilus coruscus TaxID=42192 RepID=A0A6J8EGE2_MYTCO|nr:unnamed protein product [Mytilus coruscus]